MIGKTLAHYEILELIGRGGMGEVYRARDTKLDREVALKLISSEMSGDPERVARFRREARTLATLQHAHVASVYGFEDTPEARFLVMELVEGEDLEQRLRRGAIPVEEARQVAMQIAEGLEAAHEQGVVHRDLKPANIKITPAGQVKILDFGLARAYHGDAESVADPANSPTITAAMTQAGTLLGTAAYMSPEQARGKTIDKRADIWAFGVMLHEMLSGAPLFAGDTVSDTLAGVLKSEIDLSALPADCPAGMRRLLERCLDRDPQTRLRDIGEARVRLGRPDAVEPAGSVDAGSPRTKRTLRQAVIGAVAGILGGATLMWLFGSPGGDAGPKPQVRFSIPRSDSDTPRAALSPDGSRIVYVDQGRLWLRVIAERDSRAVLGSEGALLGTWSPDGQWIAYSTLTELFKSRPDGSSRTPLCPVSSDMHPWAGSMTWLQDGRIVFSAGDGGIQSVSSSGGDPSVVLDPAEGETDFHNVSALPGDRGLLFHPHVDMAFDTIELYADGERRTLLRMQGQQLSSAVYAPGHLVFARRPDNPGVWAVPFSLERLEVTGEPFLVQDGASFPVASLDGDLAVASNNISSSQLVRLDARGNVIRELGEPMEGGRDLAVSPDGLEAAVVIDQKDSSLWIIELASGERQRLTFQSEPCSSPSWSPDGARIVYTAGNSSLEIQQRILERDGTHQDGVAVRGYGSVFTRDGNEIVLSVWDEANEPSIGFVDLADPQAQPVMIADTPFTEAAPALAPDNRLLAYESLESGRREIYVQTFPEPAGKWQISQEGGKGPFWSPSGDKLYFEDASGNWLNVVDVSTEPLRFGAPRRAISRDRLISINPLPNGEFVALRRVESGDAGSFDLWLNWTASLED